jgi:hypothetical protein
MKISRSYIPQGPMITADVTWTWRNYFPKRIFSQEEPVQPLMSLAATLKQFQGEKTKHSVAFSSLANYTDRVTVTCRRTQCTLLRVQGVAWSTQRVPMTVNLGFLDRSRYFFHSSSS